MADVPMGRMGRAIGKLIGANLGLAEKLPLMLAEPNMTPMRVCKAMDELREDLAYIDERLAEAQAAVRQTWTAASWEVHEETAAESDVR